MPKPVSTLYEDLRNLNQRIQDVAEARQARLWILANGDYTFDRQDRELEELELRSEHLYAEKRSVIAQIVHRTGGDRGFSTRSPKRCIVPGCGRRANYHARCQTHHHQMQREASPATRSWTDDEDQTIRRMVAEQHSVRVIARTLKRNVGHVRRRIQALNEWKYNDRQRAQEEVFNAAG